MRPTHERRRVLLAAGAREREELRPLFGAGDLAAWGLTEADSFERARFVLQMEPCDVLLLGASLYRNGDAEGLAWLAGQDSAPVLFLAGDDPDAAADALRHGAHLWMPRSLARPALLAATLARAADLGELRRRERRAAEVLEDCRRQVSRLVSLLWEASGAGGRARWFNQRHMLERLEEEVARARRHGGPLTVVLGEVQAPPGESGQVAAWTAERVGAAKRRCDVAGQYGPHGFLLLLPGTGGAEAAACCRRLRSVLEHPPAAALAPLHACFGVAAFTAETATVKALLRRAEEHLDRAKKSPGDSVEL